MAWLLLLFIALVGALAAGVAEIVLKRVCESWSARQRVFASAFLGPGLLLVSPLAVMLVGVMLSPGEEAVLGEAMATIAAAVVLAAFIAGLLLAFVIERESWP